MKLNIVVDERCNTFEIPDNLLVDATDFFNQVNKDINQGWQMSRDWVESPNTEQRCQIAADKILTAIDTNNEKLLMLMAAYILYTLPNTKSIIIDNTGDMNETDIVSELPNSAIPNNKPLGPVF